MKMITNYRRVMDVQNIEGKKVDSMTGKVYVIGTARGVCRFTESLAIYHAIVAKKKAGVAKTNATKAENAAEFEVAAKAVRTVENATTLAVEAAKFAADAACVEQTEIAKEAVKFAKKCADEAEEHLNRAKMALEKFEMSEDVSTDTSDVNTETPSSQPQSFGNLFDCLVKVDDEWYVRISDTKLISFAAFTREDGKAVLGEKPLDRRSPANFKKLAANVSAEIPTEEDFEKLEEVVQNLIKMLNELFANKVGLENQLIVTADGKYKTYLGEYKYLLENFPVFNLASHKVIKA